MGCQQLYLAVDGNWSLAALRPPCLFATWFGPAGVMNAKRPDQATRGAGCALLQAHWGNCVWLNTSGWYRAFWTEMCLC
jgi:hypothetical protein